MLDKYASQSCLAAIINGEAGKDPIRIAFATGQVLRITGTCCSFDGVGKVSKSG